MENSLLLRLNSLSLNHNMWPLSHSLALKMSAQYILPQLATHTQHTTIEEKVFFSSYAQVSNFHENFHYSKKKEYFGDGWRKPIKCCENDAISNTLNLTRDVCAIIKASWIIDASKENIQRHAYINRQRERKKRYENVDKNVK